MRHALVVSALLACASIAHAQARPTAFYILSRAAPPPLDPSALPAPAREPYARAQRLERTLRAAAHLPRGDLRDARMRRLDGALDAAWAAVLDALLAARAHLDAGGWRVLGDALVQRAQRDQLAALDAYDRDPEHTAEPGAIDLTRAIDAYRHASALAEDGTWARYLEAWCALEMGRFADADPALRIVARSGPRALAAEARLRLGDIAYEASHFDDAARWYQLALASEAPVRHFAAFNRAWSLYRAGRAGEALLAIVDLPPDTPPELAADLDGLRRLIIEVNGY